MEFKASQIAQLLGATIEGDPDASVDRLSKIEEGEPGSLSFLANPKYTPFIYSTRASVVIVNRDFQAEQPVTATLLRVENAYSAFAQLLEMYNKTMHNKTGVSSLAFVATTATIGKDVYIGEFVFIGEGTVVGDGSKIYPQTYVGDEVKIGQHTVLYPGVKIYPRCEVGNQCILHAGVVLGADGFGFAPSDDQKYNKVPQTGNVVLEDEVEIGANTCIDKATLGSTRIRRGTKLDNLIQVAHNVDVGEDTVVAAQTGIAGSTKLGNRCMIGGQVGIVGHLNIADEAKIAAQSGVERNIKETGAGVMGSPALDISTYRRSFIHFKNLSEIVRRIEELEKKLNP